MPDTSHNVIVVAKPRTAGGGYGSRLESSAPITIKSQRPQGCARWDRVGGEGALPGKTRGESTRSSGAILSEPSFTLLPQSSGQQRQQQQQQQQKEKGKHQHSSTGFSVQSE
ncbi:unnamed protein product [Tuber aestivum]|uniref:Uncharacterized protein n=1 Tax=Tuber aestivum TaxID=59557 RepID=A0A292Q4X1_9PEZI|nr:unnamed protein product [Tuber aestivum]